MVAQTRLEAMQQMRQSGATLQQIGDLFSISQETVRQRLTKRYGSTKIEGLLTLTELARVVGCAREHIQKLRQRGVIRPAAVSRGKIMWKPESIATIITYFDSRRCRVCQRPLPSNRQVYCSQTCSIEARRYQSKTEAEKRRHRGRVAKWKADHPEQARQIEQRSGRKYGVKKSVERYQTTEYVIRRKCPIPLGTVVRVLSYNTARGKLKVEWGNQTLELPFGCVKRREAKQLGIDIGGVLRQNKLLPNGV